MQQQKIITFHNEGKLFDPKTFDLFISDFGSLNVTPLTLGSYEGKNMERCESKMQFESHTHTPRNLKVCEGMSPHIPKWTFILGVRFPNF
jgi:hypothetical protein